MENFKIGNIVEFLYTGNACEVLEIDGNTLIVHDLDSGEDFSYNKDEFSFIRDSD